MSCLAASELPAPLTPAEFAAALDALAARNLPPEAKRASALFTARLQLESLGYGRGARILESITETAAK